MYKTSTTLVASDVINLTSEFREAIQSQWITGIWLDLALTTARARELERVLTRSKAGYWRFRERNTVKKFGLNDGSDTGRSWIEVRTDATKLTNMTVAEFGVRCDLVRESEEFTRDKATSCHLSRWCWVAELCIFASCLLMTPVREVPVLRGVKS